MLTYAWLVTAYVQRHLEPLQRAMVDLKIEYSELSEKEKDHPGMLMIGTWLQGFYLLNMGW